MACASYTQRLLKLTNLADALFTENMTGRNTLRVMHIPELNAAILIVACRFLDIAEPHELNCRLNALVGVFETGLFVGLCDLLIIGHESGAEILEK